MGNGRVASQYILSCTQEFLNMDDTLDTLLRLYMNRDGCILPTEYVSNLVYVIYVLYIYIYMYMNSNLFFIYMPYILT